MKVFGTYKNLANSLQNQSKLNNTYKLSYQDSADKIIKVSKRNPDTGITVSEDIRLAVVKPSHSYMPTRDDVTILEYINSVNIIRRELSKLSGIVAVDIETRGTQAASDECYIVGIGMADGNNIFYFDFETNVIECNNTVLEFLDTYEGGFVGHNVFFDGAFLMRDIGKWINWKYDTYAMYRQLANSRPDHKYGLKSAQLQLLNWETKGDVELDEWLIKNEYISNIKKEPAEGYYPFMMRDEQRYGKPVKAEMYRAPAQILGYYCGLDVASTWQLLHEVFLPSIQGEAYEESFLEYHDIFITNIKLLASQQLTGISIDKTKLTNYNTKLVTDIEIARQEFLNHSDVRKYADELNIQILETLRKSEPAQYKTLPKLGTEPPRLTKAQTVSKNWEKWNSRKQRIADLGLGEISKNWLNWKDKYDKVAAEDQFNMNSSQQLGWLFYEKLDNEILITTDTGLPSTGVQALPGFGDSGKTLKHYKDLVKEQGYVETCLEHLLQDSEGNWRLHPQFRAPGTLTCRLAGSGGVNLQQIPKSRGYLECWRPPKGKVWLDCFVEGTEVLTKDGWKDILKLVEGEQVWQVDKTSLKGSWISPSRLIKQEYEGNIHVIGNRRGVLKVTPNHKMLYIGQQSNSNKKDQRKVLKACEEYNTGMELALASYSDSYITDFSIEDIWKACLLQADGHKGQKTKGTGYTVQVSKERKRKKIKELLKRSGTISFREGKKEIETWNGIQFSSEFYLDKKFKLVGVLGSNQVHDFVEALSFWDGYISKSGDIQYSTICKETAEEIQAYLTTSGYEARLKSRKYSDKNWNTLYTLTIRTRASFRIRPEDNNIEYYKGKVGCVTVNSGFILVRYEGQTFVCGQCDHTALEQVVLAELSRDPALYSLYGPKALSNDVYIFNGAIMARDFGVKLFQPFLDEGYIPEHPNPEVIKTIKKKHKGLRGASKVASLGKSYGMGWAKFQLNMKLLGVKLSESECRNVIQGLDKVYAGVKKYEYYLLKQHDTNNGYILNGIGRPVGCDKDYIKDIVNRVIQSTGHDIHMIYVKILDDLFTEHNLNVNGIVWDFHDEAVVECDEKDKDLVYYLMGTKAYEILNDKYLKGEIKLKGDPQHIKTMADAKCE
jgi:DNA polymerase I-like protein with 3'-5' exonuclease and polymerase domains